MIKSIGDLKVYELSFDLAMEKDKHTKLSKRYDEISAMLYKLIKNWRKF